MLNVSNVKCTASFLGVDLLETALKFRKSCSDGKDGKKTFKTCDSRAKLLFCSIHYCFFDVLVPVAVVVSGPVSQQRACPRALLTEMKKGRHSSEVLITKVIDCKILKCSKTTA